MPNMVKDLWRTKYNVIEELKLKKKKLIKKNRLKKEHENEEEIEKLKESQKKFKAQLYQVRNNKEYDALTKEIDHSEEQITKIRS
ncbi:MAG: hypothetical protein MZV64_52115 [Ignavibacteriales bacterium]|nr:hypothetical protein [Ignavibacteriales bacterium]